MQTVKLKFKELELIKTDFLHNNLHLAVHYEENKEPRSLEKTFNLDANIPGFVKTLINEIKSDCKKKYATSSMDEM